MKCLVVLLLAMLALPIEARVLHVSLAGSDRNDGSLARPLRTIDFAVRAARPGDLVRIRGGVYGERVTVRARGRADRRITIAAMPGETVILDGSRLAAGADLFTVTDARSVDVQGLELRNSRHIALVVWRSRDVRIVGNHIHYTTKNGIYVGGDAPISCTDITLAGNVVHDTVMENRKRVFGAGGWAGAVVVSRTDRATIAGNRIYDNDGEGLISLRSLHHTIEDNQVRDNFSMNVYLDNARFVTVRHNRISSADPHFFRDGQPAAGIGIANETKDVQNLSSDNLISRNIVIGTRWGFYYGDYESGGGLRNTRVEGNTFFGIVDGVVHIEGRKHTGSIVADNIFYATREPELRPVPGVRFERNEWRDSRGVNPETLAP